MATIDDYYRMIEANNRAYKIIENTVGLDEISKIMAQIHSIPRVELTRSFTLPTIPPAMMELQNNITRTRGIMGNPLPIFHNSTYLYESVMPALTYIQANRPYLFGQVNAVLSGELTIEKAPPSAPHRHKRKVNLRKAQGLMEKSRNAAVNAYISWATLSESRFGTILFGIDNLIDTVDEPLRTQLKVLISLLVVLFVDTHAANESPGENS